VKVTSTALVGRKLSMLESGGPNTLYSMRIEFPIERCTAYISMFSCWWFITFFKQPHSSERKKHCFSLKKTINVQSKRIRHFVYQGKLSSLLKGILPISPARTLSLFKIELFK
jgi:hypothetical protein